MDILKWLSSFTTEMWIILAGVIYFIISKTAKALKGVNVKRVSVAGNTVEFDNDDNDKSIETTKTIKKGPSVSDVHKTLIEVIAITAKILKIEIRDKIQPQLNFAKEQFIIFRDKMTKAYMRVIQDKDIPESVRDRTTASRDYKAYSMVCRLFQHEFLDLIEADFLSDDFKSLTSDTSQLDDFYAYVGDRIKLTKSDISEFFDSEYISDESLTRSEIQEMHKLLYPELETVIRAIFNKARNIAVNKSTEVSNLRTKMNDFITEKIGEELNFS